jgi:MFS family permease
VGDDPGPGGLAGDGASRPWRSRRLGAYLGGTAVSQVGTWCAATAVSWIVVREHPHLLGLVIAVQLLPSTVLSPVIGSLADRLPPRRAIMLVNVAAALVEVAFALIVLARVAIPAAYFIVPPVLTVLSAVDYSCRQVYVSALVDDSWRARFTGLAALAGSVGRLLGPALAAGLLSVTDPGICFLVDTLSFVLAAALLPRPARMIQVGRSPNPKLSLGSGVTYVLGTPDLRTVLIAFTIGSLAGFNISTLIPLLGHAEFANRPAVFGLLNSAVGAGALAAGLGRTMMRSQTMVVLRAGLVSLGLALLLIALPIGLIATVAAFVIVGVARVMITTSVSTELIIRADRSRRGAVSGLYLTAFNGTTPIGAIIVSSVAFAASVPVSFVICGAGTLLALMFLWSPALRDSSRPGSPDWGRPESVPGPPEPVSSQPDAGSETAGPNPAGATQAVPAPPGGPSSPG